MVRIAGKRDPEYLARKRAREEAEQGKPKIGFANVSTLEGIETYQAFEFPRGSGITWRVDPISFTTGARITELELELAALQMESQAHGERQAKAVEAGNEPSVDIRLMAKLSEQWAVVIKRGAELAGPLMIPTGKWRWRYKALRKLRLLAVWRNPLRNATANDVAWVIGFLARCQMNLQARGRHLADVARSN